MIRSLFNILFNIRRNSVQKLKEIEKKLFFLTVNQLFT